MERHPTPDPVTRAAARPAGFTGLLSEWQAGPGRLAGVREPADPAVLSDLRLDQVIDAVAGKREEGELVAGLLRQPVGDIAAVAYRHEVFRDLENAELLKAVTAFAGQTRTVRAHLGQLAKMHSLQQRQGWFLDAAVIYCDAVRALGTSLASVPLASRALLAFRDYLAGYLASDEFASLASDAAERRKDLSAITYLVRVKGPRVEVSKYDDEPDYSAEIEETFARFRQGAVKDYKVAYRGWPGMNHVGARILELVARLFSAEFGALNDFCRRYEGFVDPTVRRFDRELQFYLAYLDYIQPLRSAGLSFCLPELSSTSKEIFGRDTFDLALAARLVAGRKLVVPNDFELRDPERIIVVSGPNQGGKTTFARAFGQLHHLGAVGCPVPGSAARLYLPDQIFTHFEREEDIGALIGKLEDDLLRIQKVLQAATPRSIVVMNEIFASTTLADARFLGQKVLEKIVALDLLCVYVTFIDELASFSGTVVSMAATIVPDDPTQRTYKVLRRPADGLAYAMAIAAKHGVTYELLRQRVRPPAAPQA